MEEEESDQKSVDAGNLPWKLNPVFVAQVFGSSKITPEGIQGNYPIKYEELKIKQKFNLTDNMINSFSVEKISIKVNAVLK